MEYILRPATPEDLETILAWIPTPEALKLWGGPALTFPPLADKTWDEIGATDENTFSLISPDGTIVGFGQSLPREPDRMHLARIIISPSVRGTGLGRILCQKLIEVGQRRYLASIFTLNVYKNNRSAVHLYESLGFTVVSENLEHNWYGMHLQLSREPAANESFVHDPAMPPSV